MIALTKTQRHKLLKGKVVPTLSKSRVMSYRKMMEIKGEMNRLSSRYKELDEERRKLERDLLKGFRGGNLRRISRMVLLRRLEIKVPKATIVRPEYTYNRWREYTT
jgi:hypothetical protein